MLIIQILLLRVLQVAFYLIKYQYVRPNPENCVARSTGCMANLMPKTNSTHKTNLETDIELNKHDVFQCVIIIGDLVFSISRDFLRV